MKLESYRFEDDGVFPNGRYPALIYRAVLDHSGDLAQGFESLFARNGWTSSWRDGLFTFHHYHSTAHEVLGVYRGSVLLDGLQPRLMQVLLFQMDVGASGALAASSPGPSGSEGRAVLVGPRPPDTCSLSWALWASMNRRLGAGARAAPVTAEVRLRVLGGIVARITLPR